MIYQCIKDKINSFLLDHAAIFIIIAKIAIWSKMS